MKKRLTLVFAVCALAVALPLTAVAGNGPSNKVTGDIGFTNGTFGWASFTFSGQDLGAPAADKGNASYADSAGEWYGVATSVVVTNSTTATMQVTVTSSTHPAVPVGSMHTFTFHDLGEPGRNDDFTYGADPTPHMAEAGNIQLHYR